jgi:hypothetical protein
MATQKSAKPTLSEWLDTVGVTARERETGSQALYDAIGTYNMIGLDQDNRDWKAIMSSPDPEQAAFQATAQAYGGSGTINLTDTGGMLTSPSGTPLTSELGAYRQFGITLNPADLLTQLNTISRTTPAGRAKYEEVNNLYQQALADQNASKSSTNLLNNLSTTGNVVTTGNVSNIANTATTTRSASDQSIWDYFSKNQNLTDKQITDAITLNKWTLEDIARVTGTENLLPSYRTRFAAATGTGNVVGTGTNVGGTGNVVNTGGVNQQAVTAGQFRDLFPSFGESKRLAGELVANRPTTSSIINMIQGGSSIANPTFRPTATVNTPTGLMDAWKLAETSGNYGDVANMLKGVSVNDLRNYGASDADIAYITSRPQISGMFPTGAFAGTTAVPSLNNVLSMISK